MNGDGSFGGLSGTGILPVFRAHGQDARATPGNEPNHVRRQRSEESNGISDDGRCDVSRSGFFAALRMTSRFE
jgi:hypothetical protein